MKKFVIIFLLLLGMSSPLLAVKWSDPVYIIDSEHDDAELIFIIGHKIIAINLDGDEDDIEWGQYHHDATHDNAP